MKIINIFCGTLMTLFVATSAIAIEYSDDEDQFCEVGKPDDVFSGIYIGAGLGYDFLNHKYDLSVPAGISLPNVQNKKSSINTHAYNIYGLFGIGGVFNRFWYTGAETELFIRRGGQTKNKTGIRVESKNTYGFNFRLRGGYIFRPSGLLAYASIAAERSINHIAMVDSANHYRYDRSFGSYNPSLSIGLEKKLRNNWSARIDLSYTIGIWDDTGKYFVENKTAIPFKAKTNKKTLNFMICKYL